MTKKNRDTVRSTLIRFALWMSSVWEEDNSDDVESAEEAVDEFLKLDKEGAA